MGRLSGKVAAVTGGASGIGEETVRVLLAEGARVAFADRDGERGASIEKHIREQGGDVLFTKASIEREDEAMRFVKGAADHFGKLDILVNNAGIRIYQTIVDASEESWDRMLGVNVKGYAFCTKAAIPEMRRAGGGNIVNVASTRAVVAGVGGNTIQYDTSKAAVAGMTRSLALHHAEDGIRVNAVCPGPIMTPFHENRAAAAGKSLDAYREEFGRCTMLKRPGTPREVAACILFLASDEASFVTGTCLFVDGGETAL
ncbi:MAG: SDR family oxidoreductase [Pseudomonadota bacterium]